MMWKADTSPGASRVTFRGEPPGNVGLVFRGTISDEIWRGFRSMTIGSMRHGVRKGWRVETPDNFLSYENTGDKRRFVVFHSPTVRTPLVLRFDRAVQESLLRDITEAFSKEAPNGEARSGQRTEADRQLEPHPDPAGQPEPGRDRRGRPAAQDQPQAQAHQEVGGSGTWWRKKKSKGNKRAKGVVASTP